MTKLLYSYHIAIRSLLDRFCIATTASRWLMMSPGNVEFSSPNHANNHKSCHYSEATVNRPRSREVVYVVVR